MLVMVNCKARRSPGGTLFHPSYDIEFELRLFRRREQGEVNSNKSRHF